MSLRLVGSPYSCFHIWIDHATMPKGKINVRHLVISSVLQYSTMSHDVIDHCTACALRYLYLVGIHCFLSLSRKYRQRTPSVIWAHKYLLKLSPDPTMYTVGCTRSGALEPGGE